jgi:hypothetical protein
MRAVLVLIAILLFGSPPALADAGLEARVLRLEAQVRALQESLKAAVQTDRTYSIKTANGPCLTSGSTDPAAAKGEVFLGKCSAADDRDSSLRTWKIEPAQH